MTGEVLRKASKPPPRSEPGEPGEESFDTYFTASLRRAPIAVLIVVLFFFLRTIGIRPGPVLAIVSSLGLAPLSVLRPEFGLYAMVVNFVNEFDSYYRLQTIIPISFPILFDSTIALGILLAYVLPRRLPDLNYRQNQILSLYILLVIVSVFMSDVSQPNLWVTFRTRFLIRPVFYLFLVLIIQDPKQLNRLMAVLFLALGLLMMSSLSEWIQKGGGFYRLRGTVSASNYLSYVCITTLPILLTTFAYLKTRAARNVVLVLSLAVLFVGLQTLSRSGYYSLAATLGFLAFRFTRSPRTLILSLVFIGMFYFLIPSELSQRVSRVESVQTSSRYLLSRVAWRMAVANPVFGVGMHAYDDEFMKYDFEGIYNRPKSPHSLYLAIAAGSGFPSLAVYLALYGLTFAQVVGIDRDYRRRRQSQAFGYYLAVGIQTALIGHFVFGFAGSYANSYYAYLLLGLSVILIRIHRLRPRSYVLP